MSVSATRLDRITEALRAAGLPGDCALLEAGRQAEPGWLVVERADGLRVRVDLPAGASQAQRDQARDVVLAADVTPREFKPIDTLVNELLTWVGNDAARLKKVACLALAEAMRRDPKLARRVGEAIDGDRPATDNV